MTYNFKACLDKVLVHEGGYANHPKDPGGATNFGITQRTYTSWLKSQRLTSRSVRHITMDEVAAIYKQEYWDKVKGDDLPYGLDYAVFDFAVNSGPSRSAKFLQALVGAKVDGVIGSQTLSLVKHMNTQSLVSSLCSRRLAWLRGLTTWGTFGRGWERRVNEVERDALGMVLETLEKPVSPNFWKTLINFIHNLFRKKS